MDIQRFKESINQVREDLETSQDKMLWCSGGLHLMGIYGIKLQDGMKFKYDEASEIVHIVWEKESELSGGIFQPTSLSIGGSE